MPVGQPVGLSGLRSGAHFCAGIKILTDASRRPEAGPESVVRTIPGLKRGVLIVVGVLAVLGAAPLARAAGAERTEVVVTLDVPSLASAVHDSRVLSARTKAARLDLSSTSSASYLRFLARRQDGLIRRIERAIPSARVRWRYRVVLDGFAVVVPTSALNRLSRIAGVGVVYPSTKYHLALDRSPELIGADQLWGANFSTAGNGIKIGIVDEGIDQTHPFFNPTGYVYPAVLPLGNPAG